MSVYSGASFEGLKEAVTALDRFADNIAARKGALEGLGTLAESGAKARIERGGPGPAGENWAAWSLGYAKTRKSGTKRGVKTGHSLLRDTSALLASIQFEAFSDRVETGSNLVYAAVHQGGSVKTSGRGSGIPARPYLGFSDDEVTEAHEILSQWIDATFDASFGGRLA
jgi:phage virion morphogenesis protein